MRTLRLARASRGLGVLGAGFVFLLPFSATAFQGNFCLGIGADNYQRDVRVFNNAADASANSNTTPEADHPGALGAVLSVWKASQAWNSDNPNAGMNFDFDWQGEAADAGGCNDNIVSWTPPCGGGVLAFTVLPIYDGWTIRVCEGWGWSDDPVSPSGFDIQGVVTHELGHALGLNHASGCGLPCSEQPTMCGGACDNGFEWRTIEAEDVAELQAKYSSPSSNKPVITGLSGSVQNGGTLTIHGQAFGTAPHVKFTAGTTQDGGVIPGVVYGVPANAAGTELQVVIPPEARKGNVLVWAPFGGHKALSNPFPIDVGGCDLPLLYGTPETQTFGPALIGFTGGAPVAGNADFAITLKGANPNSAGILFVGTQQASVQTQNGTLLVGGTVVRHSIFTDGNGESVFPWPISAAMPVPSNTFQWGVRDPGQGLLLSNGMEVVYCP